MRRQASAPAMPCQIAPEGLLAGFPCQPTQPMPRLDHASQRPAYGLRRTILWLTTPAQASKPSKHGPMPHGLAIRGVVRRAKAPASSPACRAECRRAYGGTCSAGICRYPLEKMCRIFTFDCCAALLGSLLGNTSVSTPV